MSTATRTLEIECSADLYDAFHYAVCGTDLDAEQALETLLNLAVLYSCQHSDFVFGRLVGDYFKLIAKPSGDPLEVYFGDVDIDSEA